MNETVDRELIESLTAPVAQREAEADERPTRDDGERTDGDAPGAAPEPADEQSGWRTRADEAEVRLAEVAARLADAEAAANDLKSALTASARAGLIDVELVRAGAHDLAAARALVDPNADEPVEAVRRVVASNPRLFARRGVRGLATGLAPAHNAASPRTREAIADAARQSGDKRLLLRYLRARRAS